jgi:hypothetical protein
MELNLQASLQNVRLLKGHLWQRLPDQHFIFMLNHFGFQRACLAEKISIATEFASGT